MTRTIAFHARLLRSGAEPRTVTVYSASDSPPRILRRPAGGGGGLEFDVYALLDADGWPEGATYTFVESLTREPSPTED
ncbi:ABC transporter ATP-binding protein [Leifsonia xyli subsp. cynodontis DSM 46306]|uniref:Uncharacterized protein n=1 Tax=Leifsonia xyli subsp. cynodontis DSM 46306 TaxID=1389489 RepID=U3PAC9_LEIXC|nr:hypothetical protein [Leifsonia xyli]AGW40398.1 ABC transporter ATP-binding protein [Leifsonia xyli subsp. cynodontis DSM 46306]